MRIRTKLTVAAGVVIAVLTGVAFWLSYAHLQEVAAANGLPGVRGWAWPATLDLFIVSGEVLMLVAALKGTKDGWAIGLTVVGSIGSIGLNVYGVGPDAPAIEYIVAAVPPTAALLAFGALMRQIHMAVVKAQAGEEAQEDIEEPADVDPDPAVEEYAEVVQQTAQGTLDESEFTDPTPENKAAADRALEALEKVGMEVAQVPVHSPRPSVDQIAAAVEDIRSEGREPSGAALAQYFGVSARTGRRYLNTWKDTFEAVA